MCVWERKQEGVKKVNEAEREGKIQRREQREGRGTSGRITKKMLKNNDN